MCKELNKTETDMAIDLGISKSRFSNYITGRRKVPSDLLQRIVDTYSINPIFLFKDNVSLYLDVVNTTNHSQPTITVYGKISAGQPMEAIEDVTEKIICPWLNDNTNTDDLFALQVNGDSMNKIVLDKHYAVFKKQNTVRTGEIAAVLVEREDATLKRIHILEDSIILEPLSTNPEHHKKIYNIGTDVRILGKYIGCVSPYYKQ